MPSLSLVGVHAPVSESGDYITITGSSTFSFFMSSPVLPAHDMVCIFCENLSPDPFPAYPPREYDVRNPSFIIRRYLGEYSIRLGTYAPFAAGLGNELRPLYLRRQMLYHAYGNCPGLGVIGGNIWQPANMTVAIGMYLYAVV